MKYVKKLAVDEVDRKILYHLQQDADMSIREIAAKVNLSTSPCWKRIQRMEEKGIIRARVALLAADKVDAGVTVFLSVRTKHNDEWRQKFIREMSAIPEVMEIYRMSGEIDFLLRMVLPSIADYDRVYKTMINRVELSDVTSMFAIEQVKYTTALPVLGWRRCDYRYDYQDDHRDD